MQQRSGLKNNRYKSLCLAFMVLLSAVTACSRTKTNKPQQTGLALVASGPITTNGTLSAANTTTKNNFTVGESKALTITLNNSKKVDNLAVSISPNNSKISLNPSLCVLSTESNTCTVAALALESGTVAVIAIADGYKHSTPVNLVVNPAKIKLPIAKTKMLKQKHKPYTQHISIALAQQKETPSTGATPQLPVPTGGQSVPDNNAQPSLADELLATLNESSELNTKKANSIYIGGAAGVGWNNTAFPATTFRIDGGYNFTETFAVEVGTTGITQAGTGTNQSMQYYDLSLMGTLPLDNSFDIFGQIGGAYGTPGVMATSAYNNANQGYSQSGWNFLTAVGVNFNLSQSFGFNLTNYYYYGAPNPQGNTNAVLAGVKYKF